LHAPVAYQLTRITAESTLDFDVVHDVFFTAVCEQPTGSSIIAFVNGKAFVM
jgi:hypothetical protein